VQQWLQQTVNGLTIGGVYALLALGYTMVYGVLQMINFAHGDVFMLGAFGGYYTLATLGQHTRLNQDAPWLVIIFAMLVGMIVSALAALLIERIAYRPLRRAPRLAPLISAIGVSFLLENIMLRVTNARPQSYASVFPSGSVDVGGVHIAYIRIFLIVMSIAFLFLLYTFVMKTRTGRAIRSVAEDRDLAALMGVDVNRAITITFGLGAALAGVTGVMYGMYITQVNFFMGFTPGIKAFTAAVLGGIGNIPGAMLGGYFLGLAETYSSQRFPTAYKDLVAFVLLVVVLIFRPRGILGERVGKRA